MWKERYKTLETSIQAKVEALERWVLCVHIDYSSLLIYTLYSILYILLTSDFC